jgi:subtilisin family serine protease
MEMTDKAIISRKGVARTDAVVSAESADAEKTGLKTEFRLTHGLLVRGEKKQLTTLEKKGYRVKLLPDTNILEVGSYKIDTEAAAPKVPKDLEVPKDLAKTWQHHLVQLAGLREQEWINAIEEQGVDIVEPISAYALFVVGSPEKVKELEKLPFVEWTGPFKPAYRISPNLNKMKGRIQYVCITVYPSIKTDEVRELIKKTGGDIASESSQTTSQGSGYGVLLTEINKDILPQVAALPQVRWIEYQGPDVLIDERSSQIVAENLNNAVAPNTAPVTGYQANLTALSLSGAGVTVGIMDSGVDTHNNATMHADLAGRMAFFVDASGGITTVDRNGHGTHVAGIVAGNAISGDTDPQGYLLGQGIAPGAQFGSVNPIGTGGPFMSDNDRVRNVVNNNGHVVNNSWGVTGGAGSGYTSRSRNYDQRVRDPLQATAGLENLIIVAAAGNDGSGASTILAPWEAKNPITVGATYNYRPGEQHSIACTTDDIRGIVNFSGRGPALDTRYMPTIVAPGCDIISTRPGPTVDSDPGTAGIQRPRTAYTDTGGTVHNDHYANSGTSMAAPHVAGLCALLIEWWRNRTGGRNPSPAIVKALLINGAIDCFGGPDGKGGTNTHIPNNDQGWGRVSLQNIVVQAPASDRGPKIFSDERHAFTANGQEHTVRIAPVDTARPMRITLVWTDAAGALGSGTSALNPALVNDLDLEVTEQATGSIYRGNINFVNGFSNPVVLGDPTDNPDRINNLECVYIQNPTGTYEITIIAANIGGSAHPDIATPWQDFALVIDNAEWAAADPVSVVPVIDRSGSMHTYGYEAITRTSSKQFVELMGISDNLGIVSYSDAAVVEYPPGAPPALQTITGQPIKDAANVKIDTIGFGGCTFMADGIAKGRSLLNPATGNRAMVLLSDGFDNKGCDQANPAKNSAIQELAGHPANMPIYSCAMGPTSDQNLLSQIASATQGRYYYMPTIDDLFEIYNYIRGNITGDSIVANESATASDGSVDAVVDGGAIEVTFTVAWADTSFKYVAADPKKAKEVRILLSNPAGKILNPQSSDVLVRKGAGYVIFKISDPAPGRWKIQVKTQGENHLRFTAGAFVNSPLKLAVTVNSLHIAPNLPVSVISRIIDNGRPIRTFTTTNTITAPTMSLAATVDKYKRDLDKINLDAATLKEFNDPTIAKLAILQNTMMKAGKPDIFTHTTTVEKSREVSSIALKNMGFAHLATADMIAVSQPVAIVTEAYVPAHRTIATTVADRLTHAKPVASAARISGAFVGKVTRTSKQGSYNIVVTTEGVSPVSNTRFVRKELVSVLVK